MYYTQMHIIYVNLINLQKQETLNTPVTVCHQQMSKELINKDIFGNELKR